jgi:hypothetical protein
MHRKYDLFEKFSDNSSVWRGHALGLESARHHLKKFGQKSNNRFFAMDIATGKIVFESSDFRGTDLSKPQTLPRQSRVASAA